MKTFSILEACGRLAALAGRHASGCVHSVFRRAVNLEVEGRLVCLLAAGTPLHPYSAVLAEAVNFEALGLAPGQSAMFGGSPSAGDGTDAGPCVVQGGGIALEGVHAVAEGTAVGGCILLDGEPFHGGAPCLSFRFRGAALHNLSIEQHAAGLCPPACLPEKLDALARVIAESPDAAQGLGPLPGLVRPGRFPALPTNRWCGFLLPRMLALPALLRAGSADALTEAGRKLAGCGPGLTPSSDDFLVGLCAALWAAQAAGLWPAARRTASAIAAGAGAATGIISAAGLAHAGGGLFSRDMLRLLAAVFSSGGPGEAAQAAARVAAFGSTSGVDTLVGLWFGIDSISAK